MKSKWHFVVMRCHFTINEMPSRWNEMAFRPRKDEDLKSSKRRLNLINLLFECLFLPLLYFQGQ